MSGGSYAAPMVGRFFNRFSGQIMAKARTKIALPTDDIEEEEVDDTEELERDEQRELILRALPIDGAGTAPTPQPAPIIEDTDGGLLNSTPTLRPLTRPPENEGMLRAVPVPDDIEEEQVPAPAEPEAIPALPIEE